MDAFLLKKDPSAASRLGSSGKDPTKSQFLYNPNPRQFVFPAPKSNDDGSGKKGPPLGGGGASGYWQFRTSKLLEQAPAGVSEIFAGLSFYFNGRSGDKQTMHLKGAVSKHGGRTTPFMSMKGVTHVIAENLSAVKTDKAMKSLKMKVVHPDWLNRCIAEGKLLPDAPFRVVRSQKLGMDNYFGSSSSTPVSSPSSGCNDEEGRRNSSAQKENGKEGKSRQHRSVPGKSGAVVRAGGVEGRRGGRDRENRGRGRRQGEREGSGSKSVHEVGLPTVNRKSSSSSSRSSSSRSSKKNRKGMREMNGGTESHSGHCPVVVSSMHNRSDPAEYGSAARKHLLGGANTSPSARKRSRQAGVTSAGLPVAGGQETTGVQFH
ncbi:unnamed protein product [Ectocarpus fasciculatus]